MRFARNYWFRWFAGAFIVGALLIPGVLLASFIQTTIQLLSLPVPLVFISNPFIDITTPSGKVIATGNAAWIIAIMILGLMGGTIGLILAAAKYVLWK